MSHSGKTFIRTDPYLRAEGVDAIPKDHFDLYNQLMMVRDEDHPYDDEENYIGPTHARALDREWRAKCTTAISMRDLPAPVSVEAINYINGQRARNNGGKADLTKEEWFRILAAYDDRCVYCDKPARLSMDHVIPVSKGGNHSIDNVVPACMPCNLRKKNHEVEDWVERSHVAKFSDVLARMKAANMILGIRRLF